MTVKPASLEDGKSSIQCTYRKGVQPFSLTFLSLFPFFFHLTQSGGPVPYSPSAFFFVDIFLFGVRSQRCKCLVYSSNARLLLL